jgi:hypothetical protein
MPIAASSVPALAGCTSGASKNGRGFGPKTREWNKLHDCALRHRPLHPSTAFVIAASLEHDPEKWKPVFRKIMLKQRDEIMMRFHLIAS